jgi:hypothetical protein
MDQRDLVADGLHQKNPQTCVHALDAAASPQTLFAATVDASM